MWYEVFIGFSVVLLSIYLDRLKKTTDCVQPKVLHPEPPKNKAGVHTQS
jgi:hypothetical protein